MGFLQDISNLEEQAKAMASTEHLLAHGRAASATITAIRDIGSAGSDDTATVELDLSVLLDGVEPYAVTHRQTLSRLVVPSLQPGATVPVRVDPADHSSLMIG